MTMSNVCSTENDARCECRDACGPHVSAVESMLQKLALWVCSGVFREDWNMHLMSQGVLCGTRSH